MLPQVMALELNLAFVSEHTVSWPLFGWKFKYHHILKSCLLFFSFRRHAGNDFIQWVGSFVWENHQVLSHPDPCCPETSPLQEHRPLRSQAWKRTTLFRLRLPTGKPYKHVHFKKYHHGFTCTAKPLYNVCLWLSVVKGPQRGPSFSFLKVGK